MGRDELTADAEPPGQCGLGCFFDFRFGFHGLPNNKFRRLLALTGNAWVIGWRRCWPSDSNLI
jgi:hypothetical protein